MKLLKLNLKSGRFMNFSILGIIAVLFCVYPFRFAQAMPIGTLLFRTSDSGQMYGYNSKDLIIIEKGILRHIYTGHVGIYVGQEDGIDYVVETLGDGVVKNPAKYFVNTATGEKFLGAKIPTTATAEQAEQAVLIAKNMAQANLGYDLDFKKQKGPGDGDWTCVGLTEKVYESANISNPENLSALEYNPDYYGVDITPDGYDNNSLYNAKGDCFSKTLEYSKITHQTEMILPLPEIIGYVAGLEYKDDRYVFLPYTQFLQPSLSEVPLDIEVSSSFPDEEIRGSVSVWPVVLKWSLINNPISSIKKIVRAIFLSPAEQELSTDELAAEKVRIGLEAIKSNPLSLASLNPPSKSAASSSVADLALAALSDPIIDASNPAGDLLEIIPTVKKVSSGASSTKTTSTSNKATTTSSKTSPSSLKTATTVKTASVSSSAATSPKTSTSSTVARNISSSPKITVAPPKINTSTPRAPIVTAAVSTKVIKATTTTSSPAQIYVKPANNYVVSSGDNSNNASSTNNNANSTANGSNSDGSFDVSSIDPALILSPGHIVISRVGEAGEDDWLELFNPYPVEFDLALNSYRLERSKTTVDSSIMMRFGNLADGTYKTTVIAPYGRYLITRAEASASLQNQAQAISNRSEFSWLQSGYTLYLGNDALSTNLDANIIDYVGFGEAIYYEGSGQAPAFTDGNYLSRKVLATSTPVLMLEGGEHNYLDYVYDSNNNQFDWLLLPSSGSLVVATTSPSADDLSEAGIDSAGMIYLDHFDECNATGEYFVIGKWTCGRSLYFSYSPEDINLNPVLSGGNFSLNLFYQASSSYPRFYFRFTNENPSEDLEISLDVGMSQFTGVPNIGFRTFDHNWFADNTWHQLTFVMNQTDGYWALYDNGIVVYERTLTSALPTYKYLQIGGSNDYLALDEFGIWNRALSPAEIKIINEADLPFKPVSKSVPRVPAVLTNFYGFDENVGNIIHDSINSNNITINHNFWYSNGRVGGYIYQDQRQPLISAPINNISGLDLSLTLWWRNRSHPEEGRLRVSLNHDATTLFGLVASNYRPAYIFNNTHNVVAEGNDKIIPFDNAWHHLAVTYSQNNLSVNFYVDGDLKMTRLMLPPAATEAINNLELVDENYTYDIDELGIWRGTLSAEEVKNIYEAN